MSVFPFQSNAIHTRNIRRAVSERRGYSDNVGVNHLPSMHHAKSSDARLNELVNEEVLHHHLLAHRSKSESNGDSPKHSNENIITAFTRPEAWKLTFGSGEDLKFKSLAINSNGK